MKNHIIKVTIKIVARKEKCWLITKKNKKQTKIRKNVLLFSFNNYKHFIKIVYLLKFTNKNYNLFQSSIFIFETFNLDILFSLLLIFSSEYTFFIVLNNYSISPVLNNFATFFCDILHTIISSLFLVWLIPFFMWRNVFFITEEVFDFIVTTKNCLSF